MLSKRYEAGSATNDCWRGRRRGPESAGFASAAAPSFFLLAGWLLRLWNGGSTVLIFRHRQSIASDRCTWNLILHNELGPPGVEMGEPP